MGTYKLLALDMDGTMLSSSKHILPRTLQAIKAAAKGGAAIALCTGRAVNELAEFRPQLAGAVRYASLLSGGHVYDLSCNTTIAAEPLDANTVQAIIAQGRREDAMVHVLTTATTAAAKRDVARMGEVGMGIYQPMFRKLCTIVDDIGQFVDAPAGEICKINLYHTSGASRERSRERLGSLGAQLTYAEETSLEITPAGVTKAMGLERLCAHVGCSLAECVAVGDAPNDLDALRVAGLAVAMGNATPEVKRAADLVVADNDHDGVAEVIERFFA